MSNSKLLVILVITFTSTFSFGQDKNQPTGIFDGPDEYRQFMGAAKVAANGNPEMMAMIPLINDIALGQAIGSTARQYSAAGSELGLLSNSAIREDIEMVDDQYEELQQLNVQIQRRMADQLRSIDFSDPENALAEIRNMRDGARKDLNAVLLPHQVSRLKQIQMQTLLRRQSLVQILARDPLKSDLKITESQIENLRNAELVIREKLAEKIAKLQEEARNELITELEPAQQAEVNQLIGDTFDLTSLSSRKSEGKAKGGEKGFGKSLGETKSKKDKRPR